MIESYNYNNLFIQKKKFKLKIKNLWKLKEQTTIK